MHVSEMETSATAAHRSQASNPGSVGSYAQVACETCALIAELFAKSWRVCGCPW